MGGGQDVCAASSASCFQSQLQNCRVEGVGFGRGRGADVIDPMASQRSGRVQGSFLFAINVCRISWGYGNRPAHIKTISVSASLVTPQPAAPASRNRLYLLFTSHAEVIKEAVFVGSQLGLVYECCILKLLCLVNWKLDLIKETFQLKAALEETFYSSKYCINPSVLALTSYFFSGIYLMSIQYFNVFLFHSGTKIALTFYQNLKFKWLEI